MENTPSDEPNPYRAPESSLIRGERPEGADLVESLAGESTWQLLGLTILTYGIYGALYARRQTRIINGNLPEERWISPVLILILLASNVIGAVLFVPNILSEVGDPIESWAALVNLVASLSMLIWGFSARSRMNLLLRAQPGAMPWFHGGWTFLFSPLYFNLRVNTLAAGLRATAPATPPEP